LESVTKEFSWPGLHVLNSKGEAPTSLTYKFNWASAAGSLLLLSGVLSMLVLKMSPRRALRAYGATLVQLKSAIVTVMAVLALAYVMNLSGETITLGTWAAGAGGFFAFLSPLLGWLGTAVTGSDTSSNSLFGVLQVTAAKNAHLSPTLMAASNSSGGVLAKMISPQNLAIGCAAAGMAGKEGYVFRKVIGWSLVPVLRTCHEAEVPWVARGSGTGLSGGALPVEEGIVISVNRMNRVLEVDLPNQRMVVEPGVTNLDVSKAAGPTHFYPPDPSSQIVCSIGGNVAENSGGAHCFK